MLTNEKNALNKEAKAEIKLLKEKNDILRSENEKYRNDAETMDKKLRDTMENEDKIKKVKISKKAMDSQFFDEAMLKYEILLEKLILQTILKGQTVLNSPANNIL